MSFRVHLCFVVFIIFMNGVQARNTTNVLTNMSIKSIRNFLADSSFVTRQINCVLGKAVCDRLGTQVKKAIPEVVNNNCARCTTAQAKNAKKLITFMQHNYPAAYAQVLVKYRANKAGNTTQTQQTKRPAKIITSVATVKSNSTMKSATPRVRRSLGSGGLFSLFFIEL